MVTRKQRNNLNTIKKKKKQANPETESSVERLVESLQQSNGIGRREWGWNVVQW
jgi:RecB family endonuclease NucS